MNTKLILRLLFLLLLLPALTLADEFDRLEGQVLNNSIKGPDVQPHDQLTIAEIGNLPASLRGVRAAVILAKTDQGNPARLIVTPALRKPAQGNGEPFPILILERFDTFEAGPATSKLARGRDVILFDGFRYDLDTGQVVPDEQGGDLQFRARSDQGPTLVATGGAKLFTLTKSPIPAPTASGQPSAGRAILPTDFAGRFRLFANGQWSGTMELKVAEQGVITGRFQSDQTGTSYPVSGQVGPEFPERVHFAITFPRSRQEFDGRLWTEGKGAMAGTVSLLNYDYGFFALREGARFAPEDVRIGAQEKAPTVISAALDADGRLTQDEKAVNAETFTAALKTAVTADPATQVNLRVPTTAKAADVLHVVELIRAAGVHSIRLLPANVDSGPMP
jgi:hypothetical protein